MKNKITIALLALDTIWLLVALWFYLDLPPLIHPSSTNKLAIFINLNWFIGFCILFILFYVGFFMHCVLNKAFTTKQRIGWAAFIVVFNGLAFNIYWLFHVLKQHK